MEQGFQDPYNVKYFFGFIAVLSLPTLPAILTWVGMLSS